MMKILRHSRRYFDVQIRSGQGWTEVRLLDATVRRDGPTAEFQAKMQPRNHVVRATAEMAYRNVRLINSARYLRNAPAYSDQRVI